MKNKIQFPKKNTSEETVKGSIIYVASGLILKCFSFFLLPLYTVYLSTSDYGVTSIASSFLTVSGFITAFSLYSAILRFYVEYKDDQTKLQQFYGTIICFVFLTSIVVVAIMYLAKNLLIRFIFTELDFYPLILICLLNLIFACQHQIYENILKSQQKAVKFGILSIAYFLLNVGLNIVFVVLLKMGATGVLLAQLISSLCYFIYFIVDLIIHRQIIFCIKIDILKESLKYSLPILPHNLTNQIVALISKVLIKAYFSYEELGLFAIASQFGNIADTIQTYVYNGYSPWLFEKLKADDFTLKTDVRDYYKKVGPLIGILFLGIALFAQDYVVVFLDDSYASAWQYVPLIVLQYAIKTAYYFYLGVLFYYKKASQKLFLLTMIGGAINILLSALLIPTGGIWASIGADMASILILTIGVIIFSKKYKDIGLKVNDFIINYIILAVLIGVGLVFSFTTFISEFSILNFIYKFAILLVYIGIMAIIKHKEIKQYFLRKRKISK